MLETPQRIEPARLEDVPEAISDLVAELATAATKLEAALYPKTAASLAHLVRIMNSYYSNLIEGNNTRPRDIERALAGQFDNGERRNLQIEAAAHVRLQAELDRRFANGELTEPTSTEFISWLHKEFYRDAPREALIIKANGRSIKMVPGQWRSIPNEDVSVGRHQPPSSEHVAEFMRYFAGRYQFERLESDSYCFGMNSCTCDSAGDLLD